MTDALKLPTVAHRPDRIAPLENGDRLTREVFHRRYEAMGRGVRAELVEGTVYLHNSGHIPSPVSLEHFAPHAHLIVWAGMYCAKVPALLLVNDGSLLLDGNNEPQPDLFVAIREQFGGQTKLEWHGDKRYVAGAPELVGEVAASTATLDLHAKLRSYERNGAKEYLVALTHGRFEVRWLSLTDGHYQPIIPDASDGLLKSRVFPGLWLDADALLAGDLPKLAIAVERGCATHEHAAFIKQLASAGA